MVAVLTCSLLFNHVKWKHANRRTLELLSTVGCRTQMRSYYESIDKEDKIGTEAFRRARAKVFNYNKTSVGRDIVWMRHPLSSVCAQSCDPSLGSG